jgi:hypothetical protein
MDVFLPRTEVTKYTSHQRGIQCKKEATSLFH